MIADSAEEIVVENPYDSCGITRIDADVAIDIRSSFATCVCPGYDGRRRSTGMR